MPEADGFKWGEKTSSYWWIKTKIPVLITKDNQNLNYDGTFLFILGTYYCKKKNKNEILYVSRFILMDFFLAKIICITFSKKNYMFKITCTVKWHSKLF